MNKPKVTLQTCLKLNSQTVEPASTLAPHSQQASDMPKKMRALTCSLFNSWQWPECNWASVVWTNRCSGYSLCYHKL